MSQGSGKLRADTNRVRTSSALHTNELWTNVIGVEQSSDVGSNAAVEAALRAPGNGSGVAGIKRGGTRFDSAIIHPSGALEELAALARIQGGDGDVRGGCRVCGGLGHLTKQCRNRPELIESARAPQQQVYELVAETVIEVKDPNLSDSDISVSSDSEDEKKKKKKSKKRKHKASKKRKKQESSSSDSGSSDSESEKKKKRKQSKKSKKKKSKKESSSSSSS